MRNIHEKLNDLLGVVEQADKAVLQVYDSEDLDVRTKEDKSPITRADIAAHTILMTGISRLFNGVPIISEEGDTEENKQIVKTSEFWLVDPLDGTREFISRSGHFTICAALIEDDKPCFGIVSAPAMEVTYYGGPAMGSYRVKDGVTENIHVKKNSPGIVLGSRSALNSATANFIHENYPDYELRAVGSQLKLPQIAEGSADVYPRVESPLHLWDLAAGHAILLGAGGRVTRFNGSAIEYHNESLLVGDFIAKNY
jgi:3'(2'), 5'-bisphosphate nucleotidase